MQFNVAQREISLKIVFYGPPLSGKTSNLQSIHKLVGSKIAGRLTALDTSDDRTLFFDLLPLTMSSESGYSLRIKLYTVPGQVVHAATRKLVLAGADGVVFIADSQLDHARVNNEYWHGMQEYLKETGADPGTIPTVIQFNKRDLPKVRTSSELMAIRERSVEPVFEAVAVRGEGVMETLQGMLGVLFKDLNRRYEFERKFNISGREFMVMLERTVRENAETEKGDRFMTDPFEAPDDLSKLLDVDSFRDVCRSFSDLYGIGIKIFDSRGKKLVDVRASTGDHCGYLFSVHPTRVMCTNLVGEIRTCGTRRGEATQVDCFSGLRYKIVPVVHDGVALGRVILGPYAPSGLEGPPDALREHEKAGLNFTKLGEFLNRIPRAGNEAVVKVLAHLENVLDVILHTGYKSYVTSQLHIASITGAFEDVEKSNKSLLDANSKLQELDRLKSNFIATVSHELRTPLTSVIGYSEMLLEGMAGQLNDDQRDYVKTILEKGESLLSLIGQVLDLSRIESGNVLINRDATDLRELFKYAVSDVTPQAMKRELTINVEIADDVDSIRVDSDKIRRVVTNLLGNAVKFTPVGGTVTLFARVVDEAPSGVGRFDMFEPERNKHLEIRVADSGVGIPPDQLERVFDSFFQVDSSSTREFGGTGLGLAIVRNFVRAHGGDVLATSVLGEGSTFTVLLPYHAEAPLSEAGSGKYATRTL